MTFPIVERELRVGSRRPITYWNRIFVALSAFIATFAIGTWMMETNVRGVGPEILKTVAPMTFFYCLILGAVRTSDCVSEEKREGTLGLMFLTDLRGIHIILGKMAAYSLAEIYGLMAIIPIMCLPILAGGVSPDQLWRIALVLFNTLFFSLCVGIFCSTLSRRALRAMWAAIGLTVLLASAGPLWVAAAEFHAPGRQQTAVRDLFLATSPGYGFALGMQGNITKVQTEQYWMSLALIHGIAWGLLLAAGRLVPLTWKDRDREQDHQGWRQWLYQRCYGDSFTRTLHRIRSLAVNPVYWLCARDRLKTYYVWGVLALLAVLWLLGAWRHGRAWTNPGTYVLTAFVINSVLKLWLCSVACQRFLEDRRTGALEMLLATPLSVRAVIEGQLLAFLKQFGGPLLVVLGVESVFLVTPVFDRSSGVVTDDWIYVWLAGMTVLVADLWAISWLGMWRGLSARNMSRAAVGVMSRILFLPWALYFLLMIFLGIIDGWRGPGVSEAFLLGSWVFISLGVDCYFFYYSRQGLMGLREIAVYSRSPAGKQQTTVQSE